MREILFRGKRIDNGECVYGNLSQHKTGKKFIKCGSAISSFEVIPETIGQYTGLTDKNGTKIFEWDIVKITDTIVEFETTAFIEFGNPNGFYNWGWQLVPLQKKPFAVEILHWCDMEETGAYIEVIGNIHDNPELLKGGAE